MRIAAMQEQERMRFKKDIMMMNPNSVSIDEGSLIVEQQREIINREKKISKYLQILILIY